MDAPIGTTYPNQSIAAAHVPRDNELMLDHEASVKESGQSNVARSHEGTWAQSKGVLPLAPVLHRRIAQNDDYGTKSYHIA